MVILLEALTGVNLRETHRRPCTSLEPAPDHGVTMDRGPITSPASALVNLYIQHTSRTAAFVFANIHLYTYLSLALPDMV